MWSSLRAGVALKRGRGWLCRSAPGLGAVQGAGPWRSPGLSAVGTQGLVRGVRSQCGTGSTLSGTSARDRDTCPRPRAQRPHLRDSRRPGAGAGLRRGAGGGPSPALSSVPESEALLSPGRRRRGGDSSGYDSRVQSQGLLRAPGSPTLLRKFAEVGFINAEVRPGCRWARGHGSPRAAPQSSAGAVGAREVFWGKRRNQNVMCANRNLP